MVLFVLFFGCSKPVGARPKEVNLLPLFPDTKDTSRITRATSVTQRQVNRDAQARKETISVGSSSNQEEIADSKRTMTRFQRSLKRNNCIKKFVYRVIYNYFFAIPVCKQHKGCNGKFKTVNFSNGKTLAIRYDCYKWYQAFFKSIYYFIYFMVLTQMNKWKKQRVETNAPSQTFTKYKLYKAKTAIYLSEKAWRCKK